MAAKLEKEGAGLELFLCETQGAALGGQLNAKLEQQCWELSNSRLHSRLHS